MPGTHSYADVVSQRKNKVVVFGDSIIRRINRKEFNQHLKSSRAYIKYFPGATADEIDCYTEPTIKKMKPDTVILHVGTNDIRRRGGENKAALIADDIIKVGLNCKARGVKNIVISSITCRRNEYENKLIADVNNRVKSYCEAENFVFIHNASITQSQLWDDGLHLNDEGVAVLANTFINFLNYYKF